MEGEEKVEVEEDKEEEQMMEEEEEAEEEVEGEEKAMEVVGERGRSRWRRREMMTRRSVCKPV